MMHDDDDHDHDHDDDTDAVGGGGGGFDLPLDEDDDRLNVTPLMQSVHHRVLNFDGWRLLSASAKYVLIQMSSCK